MAKMKKSGSSKKAAPRKPAAKKSAAKRPAKKGAAKKGAAKKATAKKTTKKAAKKTAKKAAKKGGAKKAAKKAPAKKAAAKKGGAKKAAKKVKKATKRAPNPAFMKAMTPDGDLAAVIGNKPMPRTEVTKKVWEYVRKHNLQDANERRMINADDNLKKVFDGKSRVSMFEMTKLVNNHLK